MKPTLPQLSRLCLALGILFALVLAPLQTAPEGWKYSKAHAGFFSDELEIFEEILDLVAEKYVYPPNYQKMFTTAIDQMLELAPEGGLTLRNQGLGRRIDKTGAHLIYHLNFSRQDNMRSLRQVYRFLLKHFSRQIEDTALEEAAIIGIMGSLDPYSLFMGREEFENSMRDTEGQYGGLGMVIAMEDYQLVVVKTMKASPARRAGMEPGDIITHVDGEKIHGLQIHELASRLRGYPDTQVSLRILRPQSGERKTFSMVREIISIETVQYRMLEDGTGYIKISSFSKRTNDELESALADARNHAVKAFILDLRDNPGGLLNQSVLVASHFLEEGKLVVYTRGRHKRDSQEYEALDQESFHYLPVAVLINHHSASASEIVAGSLRDSGKAVLIGETSYGKGSVQTIYKMSDGSGLRLTTSKYFTPSGTDISERGVIPEILIEKDLPPDPPTSREPTTTAPAAEAENAAMQIKESELQKYLKDRGIHPDKETDPLVHFAQLVLKDTPFATRSHTLARARELVQEIHY